MMSKRSTGLLTWPESRMGSQITEVSSGGGGGEEETQSTLKRRRRMSMKTSLEIVRLEQTVEEDEWDE